MSKTHSPIEDISTKHAYLVTNQDVRGVGQPYAFPADFREASLPVDPNKLSGYSTTVTMASIPSPIVGKYIQLPDGTVSTPGLSWAADTDTGLYRESSGVFSVAINGVKEVEFNSSGIAIANLTDTYVVFAGTSGQLQGEAALSYNYSSDILTLDGRLIVTLHAEIGTATDSATATPASIGPRATLK